MAERVDISRLGGNEHDLNRTSVVFLKDKAPMHIALNNYMMEGEFGEFKVVKENGNSRPFLVVDHPELHAKIAIYLTSSINEARMNADNAIRGEHLFETPYGLMNYISKSSVTGMLDDGKKSVIDRDRFFFITDDWIDEKESRAKGYGEFKIGLNAHARNLREIDDTLSKDLSRKNYLQMITGSPAPELWVYRMGEQRPYSYHPSAQYLMLALNMMVQYKNNKWNLSNKSLKEMGELAGKVAYVYSEYCAYLEKLNKLELTNPKLYEAFVQTRYWYDQITKTMEKNIRKNASGSKLFAKPNAFSNLYGNPKFKEGASLEEIITQELQNIGIRETKKDAELKYSNRSMIKNLLATEKSVYLMIGDSANRIVEFLNSVNSQERINLSSYPYAYNFWTRFYDNYEKDEYIEHLSKDFQVKYSRLAKDKEIHDDKRRVSAKSEGESKKQAELAQKQREKERKAKIAVLEKKIRTNYIEQYFKAYKMFEQGKLVPISAEDVQCVKKLSTGVLPKSDKLVIGEKLATKMRDDISNIAKMSTSFKSLVDMAKKSEKSLVSDKAIKDNETAISLMGLISEAEERVMKKNKKLSARDRRPLVHNEIHELLNNLPAEEVDKFLTDDFLKNGKSDEILKKMQDVYHAITTLRSYSGLRENRIRVIEAINEINDQKLIEEFQQSREAIDELQSKGLVLPAELSNISIEQMNNQLNKMVEELQKKIATKDDYVAIEESLKSNAVKMRKLTTFSRELLSSRKDFIAKLEKYQKTMGGVLGEAFKQMDKQLKLFDKSTKDDFENVKVGSFEKNEDGVWVSKNDLNLTFSDDEMKDIIASYKNDVKVCLDYRNYCDPEEDKVVVKALYEKLFPSAEEILADTRRSVANAKSIGSAIDSYKQASKKLEELAKEKNKFIELIADKYSSILKISRQLLEISQHWGYLIRRQCETITAQVADQGLPELAEKAMLKGVDNVCYSEQERSKQEINAFKQKFRKRVLDLIDGYAPRIQNIQPIEQYLSKSVAKNMTVDGMLMPKSIAGEHGLLARFKDYLDAKVRLCDIFCAIRTNNTSKYKPSEVEIVYQSTVKHITKAIDMELIKAQEIEISQEILNIKESLREFARLSKLDYLYLVDPKGFEADIRKSIKINRAKGDMNCTFRKRGSRSQIYGVDYFNAYEELLKALPEVRKTISSSGKYTKEVKGVELVGDIDHDWVAWFIELRDGADYHCTNPSLFIEAQKNGVKGQVKEQIKEISKMASTSSRAKEVLDMMPNLRKLIQQFDSDDAEQD